MEEVYFGADIRGIWNHVDSDSMWDGILCNYELLHGFYSNIMMKSEGGKRFWKRYSGNMEGQSYP